LPILSNNLPESTDYLPCGVVGKETFLRGVPHEHTKGNHLKLRNFKNLKDKKRKKEAVNILKTIRFRLLILLYTLQLPVIINQLILVKQSL
jgi:hypothetical protein